MLFCAHALHAASGTWSTATSGTWSDATKWSGGVVADGSGSVADFNNVNITTDTTVQLDTARTIGSLVFGDVNISSAAGWTLSNNGNAANVLTLDGSSSPAITVNTLGAGKGVTISAILNSTTGMTKRGLGALTLNAQATYTGTTNVNAGTLNLNFSAANAPASDIINNSSPLTLSGGTLQIIGNASTASSQTFNNLTMAQGPSVISAAPASGSNIPTVALGTIPVTNAPAGATIQFNGAATTGAGDVAVPATANFTTTSSSAGSGGIIGGIALGQNGAYATVGLYDWAAILSGTIVGGTQVPSFYQTTGVTTAGNYDFNPSGVNSIGNAGGASTIRFNAATSGTINSTAFTWQNMQGVLVTPNVGANNVALTGNTLQFRRSTSSGNSYGDIWQNNTQGFLTVSLTLGGGRQAGQDNGLVQAGLGTVVYTASNSYGLNTYLNGGYSLVNANSNFGTVANASLVTLNGGTVVANATFAMENAGANLRPLALGSNGGGLSATAGNTLTINGIVSGSGALTIGIPPSSANGNTRGLLPGTGTGTANPTPVNATGTVVLNGANSYSGGTILQSGTLNFNGLFALGGANFNGLIFDGGALQYANPFPGTNGASDISSATTLSGQGPVTIRAGGGTIDTNGIDITFAGSIGNNGSGGLTKVGNGTLTLAAANNYSGGTTINGGTLLVTNTAGSATGSGAVTLNNGTTLAGNGFIAGPVTSGSGARIVPGNAGVNNGVGTLTLGSLTLSTGSVLDMEFSSSPAANDLIAITTPGGLTLTGGSVNVYAAGSVNPFTTAGTYNLFQYTGALSGSAANLTVANQSPGLTYTFNTATVSGTNFVRLTIGTGSVKLSNWNVDQSGSWSTASNWSNGLPDGAGNVANFGTVITAPRTVTLDGNHTVGTITFTGSNSYTLTPGTGGALTLNGSSNSAQLTVNSGTHAITAPIHLTSTNTVATVTGTGTTLTVSGVIDGISALLKNGLGILDLSGSNSYSGGTTINAGAVRISSISSLGNIAANTVINSGTLEAATNITTSRNLQVGATDSGIQVDTGATYTINGIISDATGAGTLNKVGLGTLVLTNSNSYTGGTVINAGTLAISSNSNLGNVDIGAGVTLNGGTLNTLNTMSLDNSGSNARAIVVNNSGSGITAANGTTLTINSLVSGAGSLALAGNGSTIVLTASNTRSGSTTIGAGATVNLGNNNAAVGQTGLGTGTITFNGGTLQMNGYSATSGVWGLLTNNLVVPGGQTGTLFLPVQGNGAGGTSAGSTSVVSGALTGSGTLNLYAHGTRDDLNWNASTFAGTINAFSYTFVTTGSGTDEMRLTNGNGFAAAKLHLANGVNLNQSFNPPQNSQTIQNIGELSGDAGSFLSGQTVGGRFVNWTIGALSTNSTFAGTIRDGNVTNAPFGPGPARLTKVGSGTLTLTGTNTFTGGTTISGGVLRITNGYGLGLTGSAGITIDSGAINGAVAISSGGTLETLTDAPSTTYALDASTITGLGVLNKTGAGTLVINSPGTFGGETLISSGTLIITSPTALQNSIVNQQGGKLVVSSSAALDVTFGGLKGSQNLALSNDAGTPLTSLTIGNNNNQNPIYSGTLSGAAALIKTGTNTQALTGVNTYTGGTQISQGVLQINNNASLGATSGTATISSATLQVLNSITTTRNFQLNNANSIIQVDSGATYTISGSVADSLNAGGLTKAGLGTLVLAGNNSYSLGTTINGGTLRLDYSTQNNNKIAGPLTFGGGSLYLLGRAGVATSQTVGDITVNGGSGARITLDSNTGTGVTLSGTALTGFGAGSALDIQTIGAGNALIVQAAPSDTTTSPPTYGSRVTFTTGTTPGNTNWATSTSSGPTYTISAYNAYNAFDPSNTDTNNSLLTGGTTLTASKATNSLKVTTTGTGQTLDLAGNTLTLTNGGLLFTGSDDYTITSGTIGTTFAGVIVQQYGSGNLVLSSTIGDNSGTNLTKAGPGTLTLTSSNTYTGQTFIVGGTLSINASSQLGTTGNTAVNINGGALQSTGSFTLARAITVGGNGATLTVTSTNNMTVSGILSQVATTGVGGALTKTGSGNLTLTGANTFTGDININGGTLLANRSNNVANPLTSALGNPQVARNITVNNGGTLNFVVGDTLGGATTDVLSRLIINPGGTVTNTGGNFTTLGPVQLNGGTLTGVSGAAVGFQMYSLRGTVTVGGTTASTISSGTGTFTGYHLGGNTTFDVADVTSSAAPDLVVSATMIDQTATQNAPGGLTKTGVGTMTFTGSNAYTGQTTILNGKLALSGSGTLSSTRIVAGSISGSIANFDVSAVTSGTYHLTSGQTLAGTGSVTGAIALDAGASLAPGDVSSGKLTVNNNVTFAGNTSHFSIRLGQTATNDTDQLVTNASSAVAVALNGADLSLTLGSNYSHVDGLTFLILNNPNAASTFSGTFAQGSQVTVGTETFNILYGVNANASGVITALTGGNDIALQSIAAVPEPGTWAMMISGAGMLIMFRKRSRRR